MKRTRLLLVPFVALILISCSKSNRAYEAAVKADTVAAYQRFVDDFPDDLRKERALVRIDDLSWELAKKSNTVAGIENYIAQVPKGRHLSEASASKERLIIDTLPFFEGKMSGAMPMNGGPFMMEPETTNGDYQILTSSKTTYKGLEVTDSGIRWKLGKRYRVRGALTGPPDREHLVGVQFIDARLVELLEDK